MAINKTQILQAARACLAKGQLEKAIEEWQKLISESPNDGNIYNIIGDIYLKMNDLSHAIDSYLEAAEVFHSAGFALKTIAVYKKIIKLSPKRYDVYLKLANVNAERGLTGNAIEDYLAVAKHYSQDGRIKEALAVYRKIANLDPSNTNIRLQLAEMCSKEGYEEQAMAEYLHAASTYTKAGNIQEAERIYEQVLKLDPQNEAARTALGMEPSPTEAVKLKDLLPKAETALEMGDDEQAEQFLRQLASTDPTNPIYQKKLGHLFLKKGQQFMAFTALRSAALGYLKNGETAQAAKLMREYLAAGPDQIEAHQILAMVYERQGDLDQAIAEYVHVIDDYLAMGDLVQAQPIYEKIKALNAEHPNVKQLHQTFEDRQIESLSPSALLESTFVQTQEELSEKPTGLKEPSLDDTMLKNLCTEAEVYIKYGLVSKAIEQFEQVLALDPDNIQARLQLKELYKDKAEGERSRAAGECLKLAEIYKNRGETEASARAAEEARALGDVSEAESPSVQITGTEDIDARMTEADFYYQQGLVEEAKKLYELILALQPDHAGALAKLEGLTSGAPSGPQDRDQALRSAIPVFHEKEAQVRGEDTDYETHYHLGIAYREMGQLDEAIEEFKWSAQSPERSNDSRDMLVACLQQKGIIKKDEDIESVLEQILGKPSSGFQSSAPDRKDHDKKTRRISYL